MLLNRVLLHSEIHELLVDHIVDETNLLNVTKSIVELVSKRYVERTTVQETSIHLTTQWEPCEEPKGHRRYMYTTITHHIYGVQVEGQSEYLTFRLERCNPLSHTHSKGLDGWERIKD